MSVYAFLDVLLIYDGMDDLLFSGELWIMLILCISLA